ncbi:MAG: hypothetical protein DRI46_12510, partial [Chloroflexi bacterium]
MAEYWYADDGGRMAPGTYSSDAADALHERNLRELKNRAIAETADRPRQAIVRDVAKSSTPWNTYAPPAAADPLQMPPKAEMGGIEALRNKRIEGLSRAARNAPAPLIGDTYEPGVPQIPSFEGRFGRGVDPSTLEASTGVPTPAPGASALETRPPFPVPTPIQRDLPTGLTRREDGTVVDDSGAAYFGSDYLGNIKGNAWSQDLRESIADDENEVGALKDPDELARIAAMPEGTWEKGRTAKAKRALNRQMTDARDRADFESMITGI